MDEHLESRASDLQQITVASHAAAHDNSVSLDGLLSVLSTEARRVILTSLIRAPNQTLEYETLVDCVADRVRGDRAGPMIDDHRQRIRIALHHNHLPRLKDVGLVEYDTDTGQVALVGGNLHDDLKPLIESHDVTD